MHDVPRKQIRLMTVTETVSSNFFGRTVMGSYRLEEMSALVQNSVEEFPSSGNS